MKLCYVFFTLLFVGLIAAQEVVYNETFEDHPIGTELTKFKGLKFQGWNKSQWLVAEAEGNKFGKSTDQKKAFLIKSFELDAGSTYRWTLDLKAISKGTSWKRNHVITVTAKDGDENFKYGTKTIKEPKSGTWISNAIEFTVLEGKTTVTLQIFRFADGCITAVDNYKLIKQQ